MTQPTPSEKPLVCPACDGALKEGYVMASGEITWSSKIRRVVFPPLRRKTDRIIAPFSLTRLPRQTAFCCQTCGLIITFSAQVG